MMKTYSQKPANVTRNWYLIDARNIVLGRLATEVAKLLSGKHKPSYTPHTDGGDYVVIINAEKVKLTGANKLANKKYYRHSGFPGNLKSISAENLMQTSPEKIIYSSVRGMLSDNKLRSQRLARLKIYQGTNHEHSAQQPKEYKVGK